jgi:hypothetical protein
MKKTITLMALVIGSLAATMPSATARDRDDDAYQRNNQTYRYETQYRVDSRLSDRRDNDRRDNDRRDRYEKQKSRYQNNRYDYDYGRNWR